MRHTRQPSVLARPELGSVGRAGTQSHSLARTEITYADRAVSFAGLPFGMRLIHLTAIWAYGVAQPTFALLQGNPAFLAVRGLTRTQVVLFAIVVTLGLPLLAVVFEWLVSKVSPWLANLLHVLLVFVFLIPLSLHVTKRIDPAGPDTALLIVCAIGLMGIALYITSRAARLFVAFSSIVPAAGLVWFVASVPVATEDADAVTVRAADRPPIVIVALDELPMSSLMTRTGEIDAIRYPNFARIARDGTWFRNATTVHDYTHEALPAILTGQLSRDGELPTYADHPQNLFTLLGGMYKLNVHERVTRLCPLSLCPLRDRSMRWQIYQELGVALLHRFVPKSLIAVVPPLYAGHDDRSFDTFLMQLAANAQPRVAHFIHLLLPHAPWRYLPSGHKYGFSERIEGLRLDETWVEDPWLVTTAYQRHLLQLGYTDALLGRILRQLDTSGLYESALVIVVADHGSSFRAGAPRRSVSNENLADIASVPLVVKYPHQRHGGVDTRPARTTDVVPTIADLLKIPIRWPVHGTSLLNAPPRRTEVVVNGFEGVVTASLEDVRRGVELMIERKAGIFGEGADSLYRVGAHRECLSVPVPRKLSRSTTVRVRIEHAGTLAHVALASQRLPTRIAGIVTRGTIAPGSELAIAVNGQVVALAKPFRASGGQLFRTLVPESALHEGYNRVDVLEIEDCSRHRFVWLGGGPGL